MTNISKQGKPANSETDAQLTIRSVGKKTSYPEKKRHFLETAARLIRKKGFFATSMNDIAVQLGMNKASLYHYCRNKDEIAIEIERLNYERVQQYFAEAKQHCHTGLEKLRHFFYCYVHLMTTPIGAAGVQIASFPHSPELEQRYKTFFKDVDNNVRAFIIEGQKDGSIADINYVWLDFVMFGALHWLPRWYSENANLTPEQLADEMFNVLGSGFFPRK